MFGGISSEIMYKPFDKGAFSAEFNSVRQRSTIKDLTLELIEQKRLI